MKTLMILILFLSYQILVAQEIEKAEVFKLDGVNLFAKSLPEATYEVVDEIKASGFLKSTKTNAEIIGAAGYNKFTYAMEIMHDKKLKAEKKGKTLEYNGAIIDGNKVIIIKLADGSIGTDFTKRGAVSITEREKKTEKLVFYASKPLKGYTIVSEIVYDQGALGETMRGMSSMDVAINAMLDKGLRWLKKGKIDSDFDALIIDWRLLRLGKVRGELIKFN